MTSLMKAWVPLASVVLALTFSGCQGAENRPEAGVSVQGCVSQSNGEYHLVDGFGHDYILSDPTSEVKQNVGHEVLIRGNQVQNKRTPQAQPDPNSGVVNRIIVTSANPVSDQCSEPGNSNTQPSGKK